jgi:hypothetical protein
LFNAANGDAAGKEKAIEVVISNAKWISSYLERRKGMLKGDAPKWILDNFKVIKKMDVDEYPNEKSEADKEANVKKYIENSRMFALSKTVEQMNLDNKSNKQKNVNIFIPKKKLQKRLYQKTFYDTTLNDAQKDMNVQVYLQNGGLVTEKVNEYLGKRKRELEKLGVEVPSWITDNYRNFAIEYNYGEPSYVPISP